MEKFTYDGKKRYIFKKNSYNNSNHLLEFLCDKCDTWELFEWANEYHIFVPKEEMVFFEEIFQEFL